LLSTTTTQPQSARRVIGEVRTGEDEEEPQATGTTATSSGGPSATTTTTSMATEPIPPATLRDEQRRIELRKRAEIREAKGKHSADDIPITHSYDSHVMMLSYRSCST
jgi:hypothetical protein